MNRTGPPPPQKKQWDPALYDGKHSFVWKYGAEVIELLAPKEGERILDLGCGTGHLTREISLSGAQVTGLDHSAAMIERARKTYPDLNFVIADGAAFQFIEPFDAVFSNAALHWMKRADEVADCISRALRSGGRFVAEFGGQGNVKLIDEAIHRATEELGCPAGDEMSWYFPSIGEYAALLERHRLAPNYAVLFDRPTPLEDGDDGMRHWVAMFASDFVARLASEQREPFLRNVEDQLRPALYRDGAWFADYRRIRVVAIRE